MAMRVLMPKTNVPHFNLTVTKEHLRRKLDEYGPKKPVAISTLENFRHVFVFMHEQENN